MYLVASVHPSVSERSQRSRSNYWRAAVDIRGLALPSAAKSKEEVISPKRLSVCRIIARMRSIGFLFAEYVQFSSQSQNCLHSLYFSSYFAIYNSESFRSFNLLIH